MAIGFTATGVTDRKIVPDKSLGVQSSPTILSQKFGDGYEQRIVYGINQDAKLWQLVWRNIPKTQADTNSTFLEARGGKESFNWTPPGSSTSYKWICSGWTKSVPYNNRITFQASFRQVFEP